jgi:glucokinase
MNGGCIVADIGGSNARFARSPKPGILNDAKSFKVADFTTFYDALSAYLDQAGGLQGCHFIAIDVAGPVDGDRAQLTNAHWSIETARVAAVIGAGSSVRIFNDLEASALALPYLRAEDLVPIGNVERELPPARTMIALNVGTGFGAATAIRVGEGWIANPGEPGHMGLSARTREELSLVQSIESVEDFLSGRGVPVLYARICEIEGRTCPTGLTSAQIFANTANDPIARQTVERFSVMLGRVAGDLVLAAAAWGGVYLCGSVINGWASAGGIAGFRAPFEDKTAMSDRMTQVYSGIVTRDDTPLFGLSHLPQAAGG